VTLPVSGNVDVFYGWPTALGNSLFVDLSGELLTYFSHAFKGGVHCSQIAKVLVEPPGDVFLKAVVERHFSDQGSEIGV
jgi:hypothetical protein